MKRIFIWNGRSYEPTEFDLLPLNKNLMIKIVEVSEDASSPKPA